MAHLHPPRATQAILDKLDAQHPNADTELHYRNAFELLVATILSAQSTDQRVNMVTPALFAKYPDARALAAAVPSEVERLVLQTGFFRQKTKAIIGMAHALLDQHGGEVPADLDALVALPGVGRKTANVVLGHALGVPGLPVDRHVLRVANRIGIAEGDDPELVEAAAVRGAAAEAVDARLRRPHPARASHLPAQAALRRMCRAGRVRVLPDRDCARRRTACRRTARQPRARRRRLRQRHTPARPPRTRSRQR